MEIKQSPELREFNRLYKEIENEYHTVSLNAELSDSAFWVLYAVAELGDGCLQKDIAECYSFSPQTICSAVRSLEKKGYLELKHGKGRNMHLHFTEKGQRFVREKIVTLTKIENKVFEIMGKKESAELLRLTQKYNSVFKNEIMKNYHKT